MIKCNKIQCKLCDDIIESKSVHDFRWCKCGMVAVDGGKDYLRRVGDLNDWIELSVVVKSDRQRMFENIIICTSCVNFWWDETKDHPGCLRNRPISLDGVIKCKEYKKKRMGDDG